MRITRTQRAISAAVMTTLASATVVTFARGDDTPDTTVAALPAQSGDTPSVSGSDTAGGRAAKSAEPTPSTSPDKPDDDASDARDDGTSASGGSTSGTPGNAPQVPTSSPSAPSPAPTTQAPKPDPAPNPSPTPRPPRDLIELLFGPQPGN